MSFILQWARQLQVSRHLVLLLIAAFVLSISMPFPCSSEGTVITVDLDHVAVPSINQLKQLSMGGFTPSFRPSGEMIGKLAREGFRSMRLVNVEWDNIAKMKGDRLVDIKWSQKLERELETCRRLRLVPHIIIGQIVPHGMQVSGEGNERRGVRDWALYRQYLQIFFDHVTNDWGFKEVVWEVGNEMDNPKFNWLSSEPLKQRLDPVGYPQYLGLYSVIAEEVDLYRTSHPQLRMQVGGPALTQNSMNHPAESDRNWLARFARDVSKNNIVCDFLSMHFYGSAGVRQELEQRINMLDTTAQYEGREIPLWITEWGASAFYERRNENFLPAAGSFGLDFIRTVSDIGVANTIFIGVSRHTDPSKSGPALLNRDGSETHAFRAIQLIAGLEGERLPCQSSIPEVACIASLSGREMQLLVWHTDWVRRRMGDREGLKFRSDRALKLDIIFSDANGSASKWTPAMRMVVVGNESEKVQDWKSWAGEEIELMDNSYLALKYKQHRALVQ